MRPLRLILPPETVRQYRIMMLKVTHLPFVGIIWAYESSRLYKSQRVHSPPSTTHKMPGMAGHNSLPRGLGLKSPRLALNPRRELALNAASTSSSRERPTRAQAHSPAPTDAPHRGRSSTAAPELGSEQPETLNDLLALVHKLSAQVEELTSLVQGQTAT